MCAFTGLTARSQILSVYHVFRHVASASLSSKVNKCYQWPQPQAEQAITKHFQHFSRFFFFSWSWIFIMLSCVGLYPQTMLIFKCLSRNLALCVQVVPVSYCASPMPCFYISFLVWISRIWKVGKESWIRSQIHFVKNWENVVYLPGQKCFPEPSRVISLANCQAV